MKRNDWFLAAGILAAAAILFCFQSLGKSGDQAVVSISVDGVLYGTYSLGEDRTVEINETNRLEISGGAARMDWADCPDQVCVNHRSISRDGGLRKPSEHQQGWREHYLSAEPGCCFDRKRGTR